MHAGKGVWRITHIIGFEESEETFLIFLNYNYLYIHSMTTISEQNKYNRLRLFASLAIYFPPSVDVSPPSQ